MSLRDQVDEWLLTVAIGLGVGIALAIIGYLPFAVIESAANFSSRPACRVCRATGLRHPCPEAHPRLSRSWSGVRAGAPGASSFFRS
jgi:hypothetical protein